MVIDFKDIKFSKQIYEDFTIIKNANVTEKKILLGKLIDKYGLYVPLELIVGGRINISFVANNENEKKEFYSLVENSIKAELNAGFSWISGGSKLEKEDKNSKKKLSNLMNKIENLSIKMEGGEYLFNDDIKKWIKSFNIDNLQIIEYKSLIPIYCFIQDLENNLTICLNKYEDIVLHEIYNFIEKDFKIQEQNLFEGSSTNSNSWKVGITKEVYKSFTIYKKKLLRKLN